MFPIVLIAAMFMFVFAVLIVIMMVTFLVRFARRSSGVSQGARFSGDEVDELGADGFWLDSCPCEPGSIIYFNYWSGGVRYNGHARWQPGLNGRQFIYTGLRPQEVVLVNAMRHNLGFNSDFGTTIMDTSVDLPDIPVADVGRSDPEPTYSGGTGFPSAY